MQKERKTTLFENGLLWFGAAVSLAEIQTGISFARQGLSRGIAAILLGHLIGCALLFLAGIIGGRRGCSAMESTRLSFGKHGGIFFALLNILQLVGWTAIMIYDGSLAAGNLVGTGAAFWCVCIGVLIALWNLLGVVRLRFLNIAAMTALFVLFLFLCKDLFFNAAARSEAINASGEVGKTMSFGASVELAAAMPISWLPLISDYTKSAEKPKSAAAISALVYGIVSCWMYVIGMAVGILNESAELSGVLQNGMGMAGLLVIVISTVTSTFLDTSSAELSLRTIIPSVPKKYTAAAVAVIGTVAALLFPMDEISGFLYLIGSVFAPMIAIQITDTLILRKDRSKCNADLPNLLIWCVGFILYRFLMTKDLPVGNTLPDMAAVILLCLAVNCFRK